MNEAVVRRAVHAIWNLGVLDTADELFASDYVNHYGLITDIVLGPEAVKISAAFYRLAFPNLCVAIETLDTEGATVVLYWVASNGSAGRTAEGTVAGGSDRLLRGITRSRFAEGKIVESWTQWDRLGVLCDLGFLPTQ